MYLMANSPDLCNYCCCCCCAGVAPPTYVPCPDPVCLLRRLRPRHVLKLFLSHSCQCCCCCCCCSGIWDYHLTCVRRDLKPQNSVLYGRYAAPAATVVAVAVAAVAAAVADVAVVDYHRNKVKNSHRNHHHALWVCCQVSDILTLLCSVFSSLFLLLSVCVRVCVSVRCELCLLSVCLSVVAALIYIASIIISMWHVSCSSPSSSSSSLSESLLVWGT